MKFIFTKESPNLVNDEHARIEQLIQGLLPTKLNICENIINVSHNMLFTMIDGSICNIISGTNSTQTCYICGATPKEMNKETTDNRPPNESYYRYGLSTLHSWIRCFECMLHIAYRLPLKTWQVRGEANKTVFNETKSSIQKQFRERMGLIVDKPKPGFGSTNDGNTARRFFEDAHLSASITGVNENLISNFAIILKVMASGEKIDLEKFIRLIRETKDLYLPNYAWYYMPISIHKILIHSVISSFMMPIGQLSEDALESRHKDIRHFREHHTRKTSRCDTNADLMSMLLLTSDPVLSSLRRRNKKNEKKLDPHILEYLVIDREDTSLSEFSFSCALLDKEITSETE